MIYHIISKCKFDGLYTMVIWEHSHKGSVSRYYCGVTESRVNYVRAQASFENFKSHMEYIETESFNEAFGWVTRLNRLTLESFMTNTAKREIVFSEILPERMKNE